MTRRLRLTGRVQGVGFRHFLNKKAHELGIRGWVRNNVDGSIEAILSGAPDVIERMIDCARHGPVGATVKHCEVSDADGEFGDFRILPTE